MGYRKFRIECCFEFINQSLTWEELAEDVCEAEEMANETAQLIAFNRLDYAINRITEVFD